ncbi:MAG: sensor histidine kinase, partial [Anaerolineaceae bacterium]
MMKNNSKFPSIEPGILPLFRVFVIIQIALMGWNWFMSVIRSRIALGGRFPILSVWLMEKSEGNRVYFFLAIVLIILLTYLIFSQFQHWFRNFYLPIAVIIQILIIVIGHDVLTIVRQNSGLIIDAESRNWQLFFFLFIPVIITSWQYKFTYTVLLILFITLLELSFYAFVALAPAFQFGLGSSFLLGRSFLYGFVGYIITRIMSEQRRLRFSLQSANQKLSNYVSTQDALATARERNRLSRELHDTLAHTLSGLIINLEAFHILWKKNPTSVQLELEKITEQARSGLNETRRAIKALRATPLEEMGLLLSIRQTIKEASERGDFVTTQLIPDTFPFFTHDMENEIYRVVNEVFENIVKHAKATHVDFTLLVSNGNLSIVVQDNGIGFDPNRVEPGSHYGLVGLRERSELFGAVFQV